MSPPPAVPYGMQLSQVYTENPSTPGYGTKFWGFATVIITFNAVRDGQDPTLSALVSKGYNFKCVVEPSHCRCCFADPCLANLMPPRPSVPYPAGFKVPTQTLA